MSHNKSAESERELKEGIAQNGKSFRLRFALSELYLNSNRADQGIAVLKECISLGKAGNPDVIKAKNALARICLERKETEQARKYLDEVIKENPKSVDAHFTKGNLHLLNGEGANAVAEFRTVVAENPQSIQGFLRLAEGHLMNKEGNLALDNLRNAQKLDPASRDVLFAFVRYYAMQKDFKNGEETVRKVIAKTPDDLEARALLGDLLVAAGNIKRAEVEFIEIKRIAPRIPIGYVKSGELFIKQGKMQRAVVEYEQALKANPQSWRLANDLAFLLGELSGDISRAITLAEQARTLNPRELTVQDTLGWLYLKKGDTAKALEVLKPVQAKAPEASVINYHFGMALYKSGNAQEAKDFLKKALSRNDRFPGREEAERTLTKM